MSFLDAVHSASKRRYRVVQVPLLGEVRIQSLTRAEVRTLRSSFTDDRGEPNERFAKSNELLVAACVVDSDGVRQVSDEAVMFGCFDGVDDAAFTTLFVACKEHTNFAGSPDWKAVEDAAKN